MKRFVLILYTIFLSMAAIAQTINIDWKVDNNIYSQSTCEYGGDLTVPTAPTKYGYTFQGWASFTPIEYLESTGTQYIDTGVIFDQGTLKVDTNLYVTNSSYEQNFIGNFTGTSNGFVVGVWKNDNFFFYSAGNTRIGKPSSTWQQFILEIDYSRGFFKTFYNGQTVTGTGTAYCNTTPIVLFAGNQDLYRPTGNAARLSDVKIYRNDTLVRDMIPVLDKDGIPCMYDKVEGKFYYNKGTGNFIAGPVI